MEATQSLFYDYRRIARYGAKPLGCNKLRATAMEAPASLDADAARDEKVKVIKSLKPLTIESVNENVYSAHYVAANGGMNGYLEVDVPKDSFTETYVAIKAEIETSVGKAYLSAYWQRAGKWRNRVELPSAANHILTANLR